MNIPTRYFQVAKQNGKPVVVVKHTASPIPAMMGGTLPTNEAAAKTQAEAAIASGHYTTAWIVLPTGEVKARIPGLNGVYVAAPAPTKSPR